MPSDSYLSLYPFPEAARSSGRAVKLEEQVAGYFEQFRTSVYQYLVAVGANRADAEEFTQEAFLRLCRSLHAGQAIRNVRSWVFRVAHNLAVERFKQSVPGQALDAAIEDAVALAASRTDPNPDPEQEVLQKERWMRLKVAWVALTPRQKQCLRLRIEGLRYREIAEVLGISISTVADSLERSIAKLTKGTNG